MPWDRTKYPPDWEERRRRIQKRAGNACQWCGVDNHAIGWRDETGKFHPLSEGHLGDAEAEAAEAEGYKVIKIVCTVAHLDHDPENWEVKDERLAFLCQKCHNAYDAPVRAAKRRQRRQQRTGQLNIFN